ncbi:glutathione binding-like protein [Pantoea sp. EABMAA-21]|uniref:glutathione S-transferase family protein n=1 Tax=Enterobacterales TaxID=91347 RepID=UPI0024AE9B7F|nr:MULTISPECIES: glutathione binding-like protein [Enterobacterales]MDI6934695.1 glutathione binding-like protein [Serratia sp. Se-PFBMAAmG]MDI9227983.1 glutathione binding-like protein [Serratia bockelmannii]MDI9223627.1 glutathione binding-like protein [Pantoea sp. EA-12]MDI9265900.1 glutathione binding-like protein [Serratia sp. PF2-63]MDI9267132.1 glutathione binding-like protein [Serratia sp. PF-27]
MYTLYYWPGYCSLAAHIVLNWTGADYVLVKTDEKTRRSQSFLMMNPSGTVPVLKADFPGKKWTLSQNIAILFCLAQEFPEAGLLGDPSSRGEISVLRWLGYINSDVHKTFTPLLHPERIPGTADVKAEVKSKALQTLVHHLGILNDAMGKNRWLVNNRRSVADPYLLVILRWSKMLDVKLTDYPSLDRFYKHMGRDDSVTAALRQESTEL